MYPDFKELLSVLNGHRVKYLVVGAYAVSIHAQPRATKDIDILVKPDAENAKAVFAALVQFGAPLQGLTAADFAEPGPFFRMGREPISADILTEIPGVDFDAAWERRVEHTVESFVRIAYEARAEDITAHPRPDERHIRARDINDLATLLNPWRPGFELNLEGYPEERFLTLVQSVVPEQCTLVPDGPSAFTSEKGWDLSFGDIGFLQRIVERLHEIGCRVIVLVDPDARIVSLFFYTKMTAYEIYTGSYAAAFRT